MSQVAQHPARDRINPIVFFGSAIAIVAFALFVMIFEETASSAIGAALGWISDSFGWFYFAAVVSYLAFVVAVGLSRYGRIRLGPEHSKPEFPMLTWAAMLFAAGIGIDLLFFCVAEPVTQFLAPPLGEGGTEAAARRAMTITFLHWGLSGWGVYTLVGMSLAFFSFRHGLPLTIRSALFPIFGRRIDGWIGHGVDIAAVLGTVFGIATSLGIGIIQLTYGLEYMFEIPGGRVTQAVLAAIIVVFAALSAATGVERGIRRLSEVNMLLAIALVVFVLIAGDTLFLLNALVMNVGDYIADFVELSFETYAFAPPTDWLNAWTVFFWAWWIAWGPFVGLFLARISRGRTIGEFVAGTLLLPFAFMMVWMSVMGNSAMVMVMEGAAEFGETAMNNPGASIYLFLERLPWAGITTVVATVLAIIFFVTSGDSGSLVLSNFTSILRSANSDAPVWMRILWAGIIGVLTVALLFADGLTALQSTTVVMGLPFSIVLFFVMVGLYKALKIEGLKQESQALSLAGAATARAPGVHLEPSDWSQRIARALSFPTREEARGFLERVGRPAMQAIREPLEAEGQAVEIEAADGEAPRLALIVRLPGAQDFLYEMRPSRHVVPSFAMRPQAEAGSYYRVEVYLAEGGQGYDLMGYTEAQVAEDILDHYERHLHFLHLQQTHLGATMDPHAGTGSAPEPGSGEG